MKILFLMIPNTAHKRQKEREKKQFNSSHNTDLYVFRPCITRIVYGAYRVHAFGPQNDLYCNDEHAPIPLVFASSACEPFLGSFPYPNFFKLRRHSHYHPIKVTDEAFLSPYLFPIPQKAQKLRLRTNCSG